MYVAMPTETSVIATPIYIAETSQKPLVGGRAHLRIFSEMAFASGTLWHSRRKQTPRHIFSRPGKLRQTHNDSFLLLNHLFTHLASVVEKMRVV